jgi:hypothetical protein
MKRCFSYIVFISLMISCDKEEVIAIDQQRAMDATFNSDITPGVKNVFYEKALVANTASQLVFKLTYGEDTLAAYGKINDAGKLEYIHTTVLMKKGGNESIVTEIYPDISTSRMYTISNNVKSNLVLETKYFTQTKFIISLIYLNWSTGDEKVVMSTLVSEGTKSAEFSGLRIADDGRVWNCDQPQPSGDLEKTTDNHLDYHACGGTFWDSHPTASLIKETIASFLTNLKNSEQYSDKSNEISFLESAYKQLNDLYVSIEGHVEDYKFEKSPLGGLLKQLEEAINKLKDHNYTILLIPFEAATDTDYDEVTDDEVKITFVVNDVATGLPFIKKPVYVDIAFLVPGTNNALDIQTKATSSVNGMVTFKLDPKTISKIEEYPNLEIRWDLTSNNWQKSLTRNVSLKFIKPKVVFKNGNPLTSPIVYKNDETQLFKLVNEDDRAISVDYNNLTINNLTNSKIGYTLLKGTEDFSLKLYTNEIKLQETYFDIYYKSKKLQTIQAKIDPCLNVTAPVIKSIEVGCFAGGGLSAKIDVAFSADGAGIKYNGSYYGYCPMDQDCYPFRLLAKSPGGDWFIAANSYGVRLLSGDRNNGIMEVSLTLCCQYVSCKEDAYYYIKKAYNDLDFKFQLRNDCNQTTESDAFKVYLYSRY